MGFLGLLIYPQQVRKTPPACGGHSLQSPTLGSAQHLPRGPLCQALGMWLWPPHKEDGLQVEKQGDSRPVDFYLGFHLHISMRATWDFRGQAGQGK